MKYLKKKTSMYRSRLAIAGINLLSRQSKWTSVEYLVPPLNDKNIVNTAKNKKTKKNKQQFFQFQNLSIINH